MKKRKKADVYKILRETEGLTSLAQHIKMDKNKEE
jgi:hypothetical protein